MTPWGHKIVLYAYMRGSCPDDEAIKSASDYVAQEFEPYGEVWFFGAEIEDVPNEPKDQVAT